MRKISKKVWLIITAGIFVIALAGLFMVYSGQAGEQKKLNEQLASLQLKLKGVQVEPLSSRQAELEEQLSQATLQFETVKALLSQPAESANVTSVLFDLAKAYDVVVNEMTSPGPTMEDLEGVTYSLLPLTAKVEGKVANLVGFITRLNNYFSTGVVKSVTITVNWQVTLKFEGDNSILSVLFDLAKASDVKVTEVTSPGTTTEELEGGTFSLIPLTTKVEGKFPDLVAFITKLNSSITTTVLEAVSTDNASADIQWAVYSYQGG